MDMTMDVTLLFMGTAGLAAHFFLQWTKARQTLERFESANARFIEAIKECAAASGEGDEADQADLCAALQALYKDGYGVDVVELYQAVKNGNLAAAPKWHYQKEQKDYPDAPMM